MSGENDQHDGTGPVDYLVVEFPAGSRTDEGLLPLAGLVDRGVVRILDLAFVRKRPDGTVEGAELSELTGGEAGLAVFAGAPSALLGREDLDQLGATLEPGGVAGILVYENAWTGPFAAVLRRSGGRIVADGRVPVAGARHRAGGWAEAGAAPEAAQPPTTLPADEEMSNKIERLKELGDLKSRGALTDREFEAEKARVLAS